MRENVRNAMAQNYREFEDLKSALGHVSNKLYLPMKRFVGAGKLLNDVLHVRQAQLDDYIPKNGDTRNAVEA